MRRTPLTAMLTLLAVLASTRRGGRVRRQSGELLDATPATTSTPDHDDDARRPTTHKHKSEPAY